MKKQSWFSEYKWLLLLPASVIIYLCIDPVLLLLSKRVLGEHPEVILQAAKSARRAPGITSRTGNVTGNKYKLKRFGTNSDSLLLQIQLKGEKANATVRAYAVQQTSGAWRIYRSDTVFTAKGAAFANE